MDNIHIAVAKTMLCTRNMAKPMKLWTKRRVAILRVEINYDLPDRIVYASTKS